MNKEKLFNFWKKKEIQIFIDLCRIALVLIALIIFIKLTGEIEAVKMLRLDPCLICMNKTGATCFLP